MAQSAEQVRGLLDARFAVNDSIADRLGLSERCRKKIDKARRVVDAMMDTVALVHTEIAALEALHVIGELGDNLEAGQEDRRNAGPPLLMDNGSLALIVERYDPGTVALSPENLEAVRRRVVAEYGEACPRLG